MSDCLGLLPFKCLGCQPGRERPGCPQLDVPEAVSVHPQKLMDSGNPNFYEHHDLVKVCPHCGEPNINAFVTNWYCFRCLGNLLVAPDD